MDPRNLTAYFDMFLTTLSYSAEDAVRVLGDVEEFNFLGVELNPKIPEMESVQLELLEDSPAQKVKSLKAFLAGVSIDFERDKALKVSFDDLVRKYGEPQELPLPPPRLLPGQIYRPDFTYAFDAKGKAFSGSLLLTVDGERRGDVNRVIAVTYRRFQTKPSSK